MFIILHCRVLPLYLLHYLCLPYPFWCISLVYLSGDTSFHTALIGSPCCNACLPSLSWFIPVQLTAEPMCSRYRIDNKAYQHIISKAASLSLLSTTVGPEHEAHISNGVVNLQQYYLFCKQFCTILIWMSWVFLSSLARRGSSTGPMGIQGTETLDSLLHSRYIYWCTSSMMVSNISGYQREII